MLPLFPIPAPPGTPPWVGILFLIGAAATFVVLIWQAVRYLRAKDDDDNADNDGRRGPDDGDPFA